MSTSLTRSSHPITGFAAGVPFMALPPADLSAFPAPAVFAWHLMDAPRTEVAFAAALPMAGLRAWRIYLGLPLTGSRLPDGGQAEIERLGYDDAVRNLHGPVAFQGADEFPAVFDELRDLLGFADAPIGIVGGSVGAAVAQLVMAEAAPSAGIDIAAAVLISPVVQLRPTVDALAVHYGFSYPWSTASSTIAERLDFVARGAEIEASGQPAIRLIVGADDDRTGIIEPAERLHADLRARYGDRDRVDLVIVQGMGHALADEPGIEPAPQTPHAAAVDRHAADWLQRHASVRVDVDA